MRIHGFAIWSLLVLCSCRLVVDPERFRDTDENDGGLPDTSVPDAVMVDTSPLACGGLESTYIELGTVQRQGDIELPTGISRVVPAGDSWQLLAPDNSVLAELPVITQKDGVSEALLLAVDTFSIPTGATLIMRDPMQATQPPRPLVIVAESLIDIEPFATLDVSGEGTAPALGGQPLVCVTGGGAGQAGSLGSSQLGMPGGGGGGGGFGGVGGRGGAANGDSGSSGQPGSNITTDIPAAIRGGCHGGDGATGSINPRARGGQGGGAVYLISCGLITINGTIHAGGGGGAGGAAGAAEGGGGGGSGGYIGLEAPVMLIGGTAVLAANGGGGGAGSLATGDDAMDGADGIASAGPAAGGASGDGSDNGSGGGGAARSSGAEDGNGSSGNVGGGGGGGGAGFIYIHGDIADTGEAVISPQPIIQPLN